MCASAPIHVIVAIMKTKQKKVPSIAEMKARMGRVDEGVELEEEWLEDPPAPALSIKQMEEQRKLAAQQARVRKKTQHRTSPGTAPTLDKFRALERELAEYKAREQTEGEQVASLKAALDKELNRKDRTKILKSKILGLERQIEIEQDRTKALSQQLTKAMALGEIKKAELSDEAGNIVSNYLQKEDVNIMELLFAEVNQIDSPKDRAAVIMRLLEYVQPKRKAIEQVSKHEHEINVKVVEFRVNGNTEVEPIEIQAAIADSGA